MFSWLFHLIPRCRDDGPVIRLTADGFSMTGQDGTSKQVAWASIKEVFAFKVDLLTHDSIRLGFRVSDDGTYWQVDEDDPGFSELVAEVERRFDGADVGSELEQ